MTPIYERLISVLGMGIVTYSNDMPRLVTACGAQGLSMFRLRSGSFVSGFLYSHNSNFFTRLFLV